MACPTWSEKFTAHISKRFGEHAQQKAAFSLRVAPSKVHYWCHGATPRRETRDRIAKWSKGDVPAEAPVESSSSAAE